MSDSAEPNQQPVAAENRLAQLEVKIQGLIKDLESIKTSKVEIDGIKTALSAARGSADADIAAISESKTSFQTLKKQAQTHSTQLNERINVLNTQIQETESLKNKLDALLTEAQQIKTSAEAARNGVNADIQIINQVKSDFESVRNQAQALHTDLQSRQTDAQKKINEINDLHGKTKELYDELLHDDRDEAGKVTAECLSTQINNLFKEMQNILLAMKQERDAAKAETANIKQALEVEIRSLLPEAGAAGLSGAYVQAKSKYGAIPYDGKYGFLGWRYVAHFIKSHAATTIYYTMFVAPLIIMIVMLFDLFHEIKSDDIDEKVILFRTLITLPLAAISLFGWSSIRLSRRLYEEYNHKQRVMQLYHSFKDEVDEHGTPEHKQALLSIMLKAVDDKPSLAMHKYDKGMEELWPSLSLASLLPFLKGKDGE